MRYAFLLVWGVLLGIATGTAQAEVLITAQEAALPPPKAMPPVQVVLRGISRPPEAVWDPAAKAGGPLKSPMNFRVKFVSYDGTEIDKASVQVTYLKSREVSLTSRLQKYIGESGIAMPDAEIPPGEHVLAVELTDTRGHSHTSILKFVVGQ